MPKTRRKRTRTSKPRKQVASQDDGWYTIKGILDERVVRQGVEYLVDWDNDIQTGEIYSPTWVASRQVTEEARKAWDEEKAARNKDGKAQAASVHDSQQSQPPRWRNVDRANVLPVTRPRSATATDDNHRPRKKTRVVCSATPSEEPVPSITSAASFDTVEAFNPAGANISPDARPAQRLVIEFAKHSQFDPSEYFSAGNTQSTLNSSQSLAELEDRDERLALASQLDARTVPDSQDPSGPTWSQCQVSDPAATPVTPEHPAPNKGQPASAGAPESTPSDIPSRQPGDSDLFSTGGQDVPALATGSKPVSQLNRSGSPQHTTTTQDQPTADPVFLSQAIFQTAFHVPETSSLDRASVSSGHAAVKATPTEESQASADRRTHISNGSQDAQVVEMEENNADGLARPESRVSAVEELSQLSDLNSSVVEPASAVPRTRPQPDAPAAIAQPASSTQSQPSFMQSIQHMIDEALGTSIDAPSGTLLPDEAQHRQHATVSPADISKRTESGKAALPLGSSLTSPDDPPSNLYDSSRDSIPMGQAPAEQASSEASSDDAPGSVPMEHVVTLPFQASLRPLYDATLLEYKESVTEMSAVFNSETYVEPEGALVEKIDQLFSRLQNLCDYPRDVVGTPLGDLPPWQLATYSCDANPKFNFLYELLRGLQKDTSILIVARSVELLRLLHHLTEALEVECTCNAIGKLKTGAATSAGRVTLALPHEDISGLDYDVVVGFDHTFSTSLVSKSLSTETQGGKRPLLLILVTTHSIEHIDLHVPEDLGPLERKNALLYGIARARKLVSDPDRGCPEPHELASIFVEYLNGESDTISWEPVPVPDDVLDIYISSQSRSHIPALSSPEREVGHKRKFDDTGDERVKKMRVLPLKESTVEANEPPLPDNVREMLECVKPAGISVKSSQVQVKVSLAILQALAEKHAEYGRQISAKDTEAEYKAVISGLEKRVKEFERTTNEIYASHRRTLEDRSSFEADKKKAEDALQAAAASAQKESDKAQKRIAELEATVARLTTDPNGPEEETPLARTERLVSETQDRVQMLEKRLENARKDGDYARNLYQEASTSASVIQAENAELKEQNEKLQKKTSDSLARVHRIQAENSARQYMRQISELKIQLREREMGLDRAREELRQLRNGRRETRQVSVPRSPRMSMMSPRPGRAYGSSGSRGTSPAPATGPDGAAIPPGAQFMSAQQSATGRWNHLRD